MLNGANPSPLSKPELVAAYLTRIDTEFLRRSNNGERIRVLHEGIWIVLMFTFLTALWTTVLGMCALGWVRLPLAAVLVAILLLFEVSLTASDTHLRGILHHGRRPRSFYARIVARLAIAAILNAGTATAFDMWLMRNEALQAEARVVDDANAPIRREYDRRIADLRAREVAPFEDRITDLSKRQAGFVDKEEAARKAKINALEREQGQDLELHRQDDGYGDRAWGHGVLARDAEKQAELAAQRAQAESQEKEELRAEAGATEQALKTANDALTHATSRFGVDANRLVKERDARLQHLTTGPLTIMRGWLLLNAAPDTALAVHLTTIIAWIVLMTIELTFFLSRVVFRGEQLHDLYLLDDLRRAAMRVESELHDDAREHRRRAPLRVVPNNDDADRNENQGG